MESPGDMLSLATKAVTLATTLHRRQGDSVTLTLCVIMDSKACRVTLHTINTEM